MTVLVTGATGFIGSYLIPALVEKGYQVFASDTIPEPQWIAENDAVQYLRADLSREAEAYKLMAVAKPEKVIHLAGLLVGACEANPSLAFKINFMATQTLLDACVALGAKRFVMTSAGSVYGQGLPEPVADDAIKLPATIYGQTKLACEHLLEWYRRVQGLSTAAVRFAWVFGPGRKTGLTAEYSSKLLDAIAAGEKVVIEEPEQKGDWIYVKDAVKSLILFSEMETQPQIVYNIMSGNYTVREAMEIAQKIFPEAQIEIKEGAESSYPYVSSFDDSMARQDLGWSPNYTLEQAMREHVDLVRNS